MSRKKIKKSSRLALQQLVQEYRDAGGKWPVDSLTIATYLLANRKVIPPRRTEAQILAKQLQEALREEYYTDPQGRRVHRKYAFPVVFDDGEMKVQKMLWCDIETATPDQMRLSFGARRRQIQGDVRQLKIDADSYNDNNQFGASIQLGFNFEKDLEELEQKTEYGPPPIGDSD